MHYFVTGGTGFIGRFLVPELLRRGGVVYLLVREASLAKLDELRAHWHAGHDQLVGVTGDLTEPLLGLNACDQDLLAGQIDHFFHLAALYDMAAPEDQQLLVNVGGTEQAVLLAERLRVRHYHHVSSIAVAGFYRGTFREDMLDEATGLDNPYLRSKHLAEKHVRRHCRTPWRIYRPGLVIGHSRSGEIDKIDGLYHCFKLIQKIRAALPAWFPMVGLEGGRLNIVPVDYVVAAMATIAHRDGEDGRCFHLTDPDPYRLGEILDMFCAAGHAPRPGVRIDTRLFGLLPPMVRGALGSLPPVQRLRDALLDELGIPAQILAFLDYPTRFDNRETERVLAGSGISVPRLADYAPVIWDYWERHLDPDLFRDRSLQGAVRGKVCLVTGGTSGIGLAVATRLAEAGAVTLIAARGTEGLESTVARLGQLPGACVQAYRVDLSDRQAVEGFIATVLRDHGRVDVLINNAGRSIRRPLRDSFARLHDFERTMQLNYFGSLQLILGFVPGMIERRDGHVINMSSLGVLTGAPRFAAYMASKSALDAFTRSAAAELAADHVAFTTVNMPLVRTPMIQPTRVYESLPALTPEAAADLVVRAIIERPRRVATRLGLAGQLLQVVSPALAEMVLAAGFRLFDEVESDTSQSRTGFPSPEQASPGHASPGHASPGHASPRQAEGGSEGAATATPVGTPPAQVASRHDTAQRRSATAARAPTAAGEQALFAALLRGLHW